MEYLKGGLNISLIIQRMMVAIDFAVSMIFLVSNMPTKLSGAILNQAINLENMKNYSKKEQVLTQI